MTSENIIIPELVKPSKKKFYDKFLIKFKAFVRGVKKSKLISVRNMAIVSGLFFILGFVLIAASDRNVLVGEDSGNGGNFLDIFSRKENNINAITTVPRGLVNLGNTCFMNSILQLLAATLQRFKIKIGTKSSSPFLNCLMFYLEEIYNPKNTFKSPNWPSVNPKEFLNLLKKKDQIFCQMRQQDSYDFLNLLFKYLEPESPQYNLFSGHFVSKITCGGCYFVSPKRELFTEISLHFPKIETSTRNKCENDQNEPKASSNLSTEELMLSMFEKEPMLGVEGYRCELCSPNQPDPHRQDSSKQLLLDPQLPPFLILHLKRFQTIFVPNSRTESETVKIDTLVEISEIIHIPNNCIDSTDVMGIQYKLYGYIIHIGSSLTFGHYTAVVQASSEDDDSWVYISDTSVTKISRTEALDGKSHSPYMLFYQRIY